MNKYITFFNGKIIHHESSTSVFEVANGTFIYICNWDTASTPWRLRTEDGFGAVKIEGVPPEVRTQLLLLS